VQKPNSSHEPEKRTLFLLVMFFKRESLLLLLSAQKLRGLKIPYFRIPDSCTNKSFLTAKPKEKTNSKTVVAFPKPNNCRCCTGNNVLAACSGIGLFSDDCRQ